DYQADNNTLAFAGTAGEMKSINVKVNGDVHLEKDEIFELVLQQLSNNFNNRLTIPINIAEGVILNDDDALITITKADGQEGGNMASFTFSFPTGVVTDEATQIAYQLEGTALGNGVDFTGSVTG